MLVVDPSGPTVRARWRYAGPVAGLGLSPDGRRLYVDRAGTILLVDAATGRELGRLPTEAGDRVRHVGAA